LSRNTAATRKGHRAGFAGRKRWRGQGREGCQQGRLRGYARRVVFSSMWSFHLVFFSWLESK
jgi:hypothetical protein